MLGMVEESPHERGFRWWVVWCLRASQLLMFGLAVAVLAGEDLLGERFPNSPWRGPLGRASFLAWLWLFVILWIPDVWVKEVEPVGPEYTARRSKLVETVLLGAAGGGVLAWQREHIWAVMGFGAGAALFFAALAKFRQRSYFLAVAGWILAGLAVLLLQWPNEQRFGLLLVLGGFASALQGAWELVKDARAVQGQQKSMIAHRT